LVEDVSVGPTKEEGYNVEMGLAEDVPRWILLRMF